MHTFPPPTFPLHLCLSFFVSFPPSLPVILSHFKHCPRSPLTFTHPLYHTPSFPPSLLSNHPSQTSPSAPAPSHGTTQSPRPTKRGKRQDTHHRQRRPRHTHNRRHLPPPPRPPSIPPARPPFLRQQGSSRRGGRDRLGIALIDGNIKSGQLSCGFPGGPLLNFVVRGL